ncbi:MAG: SGNH/GDSL hydrolase family protein [Pseudomonadota bacterium]
MSGRAILCFGDSNTHGTLAVEGPGRLKRLPRDNRWPGIMAAELGAGFHVIEEGHPGRTTVHPDPVSGIHKNGLASFPAILETHRPLAAVVIMLGTNDLKAMFGVGPSDIARSVERLVHVARSFDGAAETGVPDITLVAPVPILEAGWLAEMFAGGAEKSRRLAPALAEAAARLGTGFVDAGTLAQVDPTDGIHLTADAHIAIGRAVAEAVRARLG